MSAFFNLRLLIGVFVVLAGVCLALGGLGVFSALTASMAQAQQKNRIITNSKDPLVPNGFDCSKIHELGIDKQMSFRAGAIMIACGQAHGGRTSGIRRASPLTTLTQFVKKLFLPLAYGGTDVDLITGETDPQLQTTTFSWGNPDNPDQIMVAYLDSRDYHADPPDTAGASVSTDGGLTFTRLTKANGQSPFENAGGFPIVLYNRPTATWYTVWDLPACGGLGGYKSATPWDPKSWTSYCINSGSYDKPSAWTDMNPSSPFYGRIYVSGNNFNVGGGALFVRYSTDNGLTWTNERQITTTFIRNVQITGDLATGEVYLAGMDENGGSGCSAGCGTSRNNKIYRSTDGGNTWTNTYTGPSFVGACRGNSGYFCTMYSNPNYWRYMGAGEPAAFNGVVHYVYAARNPTNGDPGNVFYIRSTDSGVTFSAPFQLNSDTDPTKAQWEPNLSVSPGGTLFAVWYDERDGGGASTCIAGTNSSCYRMYARRSNDNGVTWLPDDAFSDTVSPLPAPPEPGIVPTYASDYDYASALATKHLASWVDARVPINGTYQPDTFTDRELVNTTPTPTPTGCSVTSSACGSVIFSQPTDFIINLSDPVNPANVHANALTVNGTPANSFTLSNGNTTIIFHFNTSPVVPGQNTMHIAACAFNCVNGCVQEFTCTFTYKPSTPTPTPTQPPPSATPTATPTATVTPIATPTPSAKPTRTPLPRPTPAPRPVPHTPTPTPTGTPTPSPTPSATPIVTPRPRPTPPPRP